MRRSSQCPHCKKLASRRHSFYTRQIADLPCLGAENQVRVRCQRFFCDNDGCKRQIFLAAWLNDHPGVEVISRDRSGDYAQGARRGAPDTVQIADRWHLLKNTSDMVERFITRHATKIRLAHETTVQTVADDAAVRAAPELSLSSHHIKRTQHLCSQRLERYEQVVELFQQGKSKSEIARQLGMGRATVIAYLAAGTFPERRDRTSTLGILAPHVGYFQRRWLEGCSNISQLWRELQAQGYAGKRAMVKRYMHGLRRLTQAECERLRQNPFRKPSPGQLRYWSLQGAQEREEKQQIFVEAFLELCPEAQTLHRYATRFCHMLKTRQADDFPDWLEEAQTCDVLELRNFAAHILKDKDAVHNAMKYPWSNGQLEGQVNRLKTIKRQMYGRANFDLLRARVLYRPPP